MILIFKKNIIQILLFVERIIEFKIMFQSNANGFSTLNFISSTIWSLSDSKKSDFVNVVRQVYEKTT